MDRLTGPMARYPRIFVIMCGLLVACAFPPLGLWPLALLGTAGFAWAAMRAPGWHRAAGLGWLFGLGHFTLASNWIATAFTYQAEMPAVLGWAAVPLLACYLAIYPALTAGLAWALASRSRSGTAFALAFGACWILAEWLRSWLFTGYAWGPLSLSLLGNWDRPGLAMLLPWTGTYALSGIFAAASAFLACLLARRKWRLSLAVAAFFAVGMVWPAWDRGEGQVRLTLVQPDLRQEDLDNPALYEDQFQTTARLSTPKDPSPRLVLWPESGVPDYLRDGYPQRYYDSATAGGDPAFARARIGQVIGSNGVLMTGAVDLHIAREDGVPRATGAYNSVTVIKGGSGEIIGHYAKAHLVPYGEYLPLRDVLEPLGASRLVAGSIDFIPGPGPRTLDLGALGRAGIQICYEIVFSGEVANRADRPDYIFNPSNDGWFGDWGPPAHLGQARLRAVEEGLPVLRATTTGISAVIDGRGVVRNHIGRHRADRIDTIIPPPLPATPFALLGHWLTLAWGVSLALLSLVVMHRRRS